MNAILNSHLANALDKARHQGFHLGFMYHRENNHTLRIANNSVSLNAHESLSRLCIEVTIDRRSGSYLICGDQHMTQQGINQAVAHAHEKARHATPKDYNPALITIEKPCILDSQYDKNLADLSPEAKIYLYKEIIKNLGNQAIISGSWSSGEMEVWLSSTSNTNNASHYCTDQKASVMLRHPFHRWELYETGTGWHVNQIDTEKMLHSLLKNYERFVTSQPIQITPGRYPIIFGSSVIADCIKWIIHTGMWGKTWEEGQGWLNQNTIGDKIVGENVTITDIPTHDKTFNYAFDYNGTFRTTTPIIEKGTLSNFLYDSDTAAQYKKKPTGHTLQGLSIVMNTGTDTPDPLSLARSFGEAVLYIPALHYMNSPNPNKGIITGSSRFNALLIEKNGHMRPIYATRITDTLQHIFSNIIAISSVEASTNLSHTYSFKEPIAFCTPSYILVDDVAVTDCAESF